MPTKGPLSINHLFFVDAKEKDFVRGVRISRGPLAINHLFFADDNLLSGDASKEGAENFLSNYFNIQKKHLGRRLTMTNRGFNLGQMLMNVIET